MAFLTENVMKDILGLVFVVILSLYGYFTWAFYYWQRKGVECVPAQIPFGSASRVITRKTTFGELFKEVYLKYKTQGFRYLGFYVFTKPTLVFLDINLIKTILTRDFHHFSDHGSYVNEEHEPLTAHLFALRGQKWRRLRAKLTPTFTSGKMKMMFHTLVDCSNGLNGLMDEVVKQEEAVDIKDIVARYTTDVIGSCAFGLDCNSIKNPNSEFRKHGKKIFDVSIYQAFVRFLALVSPKLVALSGLTFLNPSISKFILSRVRDTINFREKNNVVRNDFMHLLIQLKNNVHLKEDEHVEHLRGAENPSNNDSLTTEQIAAQVFVFFVAGFETSSTTLAFCLYELSINQAIQEKLSSEITTVLEQHNNTVTYDAVMKMPYMDMCIQETLRRYPPLPFLFRECTEEYKIPESNTIVKKDMRVFVPISGIHHDPEFYPNPYEFDPERFSPENKDIREPFAWLPFGEGPRACIGLRFGLMQTKVALAVLLRNYIFTLNEKTEVPLVMSTTGIMTAAKGGIWLNVDKR